MSQLETTDRCDVMQAEVRRQLGSDFCVAVCDPRDTHFALLPAEQAHLSRATPKRAAEFNGGRVAARRALLACGGLPVPIPAGPDRAPRWPVGWRGSISHSDTLCLAVVTKTPVTIGVDIEPDVPLDEALRDTICLPDELDLTSGPDGLATATLIFSAKEACYKAQYPQTAALFGFDTLKLDFPAPGHFTATFVKPAGRFAVGDRLLGHHGKAAGHLVTTVAIGQGG